MERLQGSDVSQVRLAKPIQSIAISAGGNRAVALVNHNHVYSFDLSPGAELSDADCWVVPLPAQDGNRRVRIHDSAIVFAGEDQVYLCHATAWKADPRDQLNIQQLDLRTGDIPRECHVPGRFSNRCSAIRLGDDLLLVGCDEDAVLVQLSQARAVGTLRESLWDQESGKTTTRRRWKTTRCPGRDSCLTNAPARSTRCLTPVRRRSSNRTAGTTGAAASAA